MLTCHNNLSPMTNSNHTPVFLPLGVSRKKNDTCPGLKGFKRPPKLIRPPPPSTKREAAAKKLYELKPGSNNRVLAGCMAHEFLTNGTILGQKFDPLAGGKAREEKKKSPVAEAEAFQVKEHESYAEVADLLKCDGVHIHGIVNPTQLSQWLNQM